MTIRTRLITSSLIAASLVSGAAQAALQGRDLNGSINSFEAYYDTFLDITWLADANYAKTSGYLQTYLNFGLNSPGALDVPQANTWVSSLSVHDAVNNITYDNWRLPTVAPVNGVSFDYSTDGGYNITNPDSELAYMFHVNLGNVSLYLPPVSGVWSQSGCYSAPDYTCLDNVGPFSNLQSGDYWTGTQNPLNTYTYWYFDMTSGYQSAQSKSSGKYAWAVSDGDVGIAAVPEADTWAMLLAGLGLIGWRARRRG